MSALWFALGAVLVAGGAVTIVQAVRKPVFDAAAFLAGFDADVASEPADFEERLAEPFLPRLIRPLGRRIAGSFRSLLPGQYLERLERKLAIAGLDDRLRAEEFVVTQALAFVVGGGLGAGIATLQGWGPIGLTRSVAVFAILGVLSPVNWLQRNRERRVTAVRADLPDILDLMAISVEAGVGLEGAIEVVTEHFDTPLAHEMGRVLREMELGLSRRAALTNLKHRVDVPELSNFVMSLVQADALGMPLSRVLHAQANEMRMRRRQWARERAARLPVKIVFPLMVFILPALFVVVIGPAVLSIGRNIL